MDNMRKSTFDSDWICRFVDSNLARTYLLLHRWCIV